MCIALLLLFFYASAACGKSWFEVQQFCIDSRQSNQPYNHLPITVKHCIAVALSEFPPGQDLLQFDALHLPYNEIAKLQSSPINNNRTQLRLTRLNLASNAIYAIDPGFFAQMPDLVQLDLSANKIATFATSAIFSPLTRLLALNLGYNEMGTLPIGVFEPLKNLQDLDLSGNYLADLLAQETDLTGQRLRLTDQIARLSLDDMQLPTLTDTCFSKLRKLNFLSMAYNNFNRIPPLPHRIEYLDISGNNLSELIARDLRYHQLKVLKLNGNENLTRVDHYAFYNLQQLYTLEMDNCANLRTLDELAFGFMWQRDNYTLRRLSIAASGLRTIDRTYLTLFNGLDYLNLDANPWDCSCDLMWMRNISLNDLRCHTPDHLNYKLINDLSPQHFPNCQRDATNPTTRKLFMGVLVILTAILIYLIVYMVHLRPVKTINRHWNRKYFIAPDSPYFNEMTSSRVN